MIIANLIGHLGKDAEKRSNKEGKEYLTFNVAHKQKSKNSEEITVWFQVFLFNTFLHKYLLKGTQIFVAGELEISDSVGSDGKTYNNKIILADKIHLVGGSKTEMRSLQEENKEVKQNKEEILTINRDLPF